MGPLRDSGKGGDVTNSVLRKLGATCGLMAAVTLTPGTAWADGSQYPSGAPSALVGITYFGDTRIPNSSPVQDYYRLPSLLAGDVVTVATKTTLGQFDYVDVCLAGNIDDFNWEASGCNLTTYTRVGYAGTRLSLRSLSAANPAFLRFYRNAALNPTPYQFTIESVQHQVGLTMSAPNPLNVKGTVSVTARLSTGANVPDGFPVNLVVAVDGRNYAYLARTKSGKAEFTLSLPDSAADKSAWVKATSSASSAYLAGGAPGQTIRIVK